MQNIDEIETHTFEVNDYQLKIDDILKIDIQTTIPEFSLESTSNSSNRSSGRETYLYEGYKIDSDGFIDYPEIGRIKVKGLTISQLEDKMYNLIINKGILANPVVDIKLVNGYFTILGEVNSPGRYYFMKNDLNILEAIGMASDLTINGLRKDVKIIRKNKNDRIIKYVDLTKSDFLSDFSYQIYPGDIIIVNPNNSRVKNAGLIGNSGNLLSLLSFLITSVILITNQ